MENLLLVINDGTLNDKPLRFACYLAQITRSRLQGILLTNTSEKELYPEEMIKKKSNASAMLVQMQHVGSDNEEDIQCFRRIAKKKELLMI
ncbi:hypothetical protein LL912_02595 [Niabella sp. CC-SYL272]|uniref:hypothetical protein n=1 Tax=Niabella agricola TaxID=2891571 RepID=UPI001F23F002|nr:hypothetical protein [Niabella agricola]MCF3107660.1 hypothetical protein [Niabella agricola]